MKPHWDTWTTFADFQKIADSGFNLVRIPIGFWAYDTFGTPYVQGAAPYLDAAIDWARALGLKVIIDLHGAPGSQNGFDNSGQRLASPTWTSGDTVAQTLSVISTIAQKYAQPAYQDVVVGIEALNEPLVPRLDEPTVRQFYRDAYGNVRVVSDTPIVLHDGFLATSAWNGFLTPSDANAQHVVMDHHEYQVFDSGLLALSPAQHVEQVCSAGGAYAGSDKWSFVGEWTGAMTDCARYLNGFGTGARYDGTFTPAGAAPSSKIGDCGWQDDIANWSQEYKDQTRRYVEAQIAAFETRSGGWIWWNFKTEGAHEWDAFKLIDEGVFPQPIEERKFEVMC